MVLGLEYGDELAQNIVVFDIDNSSSRYSVNFRKSFLLLDKGPTDEINDSAAE